MSNNRLSPVINRPKAAALNLVVLGFVLSAPAGGKSVGEHSGAITLILTRGFGFLPQVAQGIDGTVLPGVSASGGVTGFPGWLDAALTGVSIYFTYTDTWFSLP